MAGSDDDTPPDSIGDIARALDRAEPIGRAAVAKKASGKRKLKRAPKAGAGKGDGQHKDTGSRRDAGGGKARRQRTPQRDSLMALTEDCALWHDQDGEGFISFDVRNHRENWPIRSDTFKRWLAARAFEKTGFVPGAQAVEDTLRVLEARATMEGRERQAWLRVGAQDGSLYLDLCDSTWRAIRVGPSTWEMVEGRDLPFVRFKSMRALCEPEGGSEIGELRRFLNVASEDDFLLVVAWLVAALRETGPYPILVVNGEQGSGKSTFSRLLRSLVDPNGAPIRAVPKDDRDLIVSASNAHVLAMDNLSRVDPWLADGLCRLATGSGFSTRKLMTDRDESVFMASRPIILNGIPTLTDRADLASRAVTITLASIPEDDRRPEDEFWADWEGTAPRVLGALCDGLSAAVRRIGEVRLGRAPRLADFAKWMTAAEPGLGWEAGTFMAAYSGNLRETTQTAFESDPVAIEICRLAEPFEHGWEGTAAELLDALTTNAPDSVTRLKSWPATAQGLGNRIVRCAPLVRAKGFNIEKRHSGQRTIRISPVAKRGA